MKLDIPNVPPSSFAKAAPARSGDTSSPEISSIGLSGLKNRHLVTLIRCMSKAPGHALALGTAVVASEEDKQERFCAMYRAERDSIARHLVALTGDRTSMEDLVNETFIRAFQSFETFEGRSSLRTWLHGIAVNVARNHRAKHHRRAAAALPEHSQETGATPEEELNRRQAIARFHRAIDELEPRLRDAFVLRVIEQHGLKEVAEMLTIPVSTAHAWATRAERLVRARIEGEGS